MVKQRAFWIVVILLSFGMVPAVLLTDPGDMVRLGCAIALGAILSGLWVFFWWSEEKGWRS